MFRRAELASDGPGYAPGYAPADGPGYGPDGGYAPGQAALPAPPVRLPNLVGDLDALLGTAPCFRTAVRGYDRMQVDNYVAWAENELAGAHREIDDLAARYGQCSAELELSQRLLAHSQAGQELTQMSERIGAMLRLAADEAAEIVAAASEEADHILAEARTDADARLRKAHEIKEIAVVSSDRLREEARHVRVEATAVLDRARGEADQLLRDAAAQRDRLDHEAAHARARENAASAERLQAELAQLRWEQEQAAAAAAAQVATLQEQIDELHRRRELARQSLRRLTDQIGEAIDALSGVGPRNFVIDHGQPVGAS